MANKVVVLGPCGAGKSSMLNKYLGRNVFRTSGDIDVDGTNEMVSCEGLIDTPGLDTVNATKISPVRLRTMLAKSFAVVLIVPKTMTRITVWKSTFQSLLSDLCLPGGQVLVVWTFPGNVTVETQTAINKLCVGMNCAHVDSEAPDFRTRLDQHFSAHSCTLRQSAPKDQKAVSKTTAARPRNPLDPMCKSILPKNCLAAPVAEKVTNARKVFKHVKAMKKDYVDQYIHMKMIGDALLGLLVLLALHRDRKDLTEGKEKICGNGEDCPMAKLYDLWGLNMEEAETLNGHSKADAVEAMLGYCLYNIASEIPSIFRAIYELKC
eukprot:gene25998-31394_t